MATAGPGARKRRRGGAGAGAAKGASQFQGTPSEAQTFSRLALVPHHLRKESDCHLPQSAMRPARRKAGAAVSRVKGQGLPGQPPSEPGTLAPVRTLPQCPMGTLAFSRKCHGGMEVGGAKAKTKGQVQAWRKMPRNGRAIALLLPPSESSCPHPSWRRVSGASGRSFMGRSPPRRRGL